MLNVLEIFTVDPVDLDIKDLHEDSTFFILENYNSRLGTTQG